MSRSCRFAAPAATTEERETACDSRRSRGRSFCPTPSTTRRGDAPLRRGRALAELRARPGKAAAQAASRRPSTSASSFPVAAQQTACFDRYEIERIRAQALEQLQSRRPRLRETSDRNL